MAYSLERLAGVRKSEMLKSLKHDCVKTCSNRLVKMMENKEKKCIDMLYKWRDGLP